MFKYSVHRRLVAGGAPELPPKHYYYPVVTWVDGTAFVRMEIRKSLFLGHKEVSRWTIDPETYFSPSDTPASTQRKVVLLCTNAAMNCNDFERKILDEPV